jgi:hypothetical protein
MNFLSGAVEFLSEIRVISEKGMGNWISRLFIKLAY